MKKYIQFTTAAFIFGAILLLGFFFSRETKMDSGNESPVASEKSVDGGAQKELIRVAKPKPGDEIESPLEISGEARGSWFFEGSFPIRLADAEGNTLGRAVATAQGEWMTEEFVPFKATLVFDQKKAIEGKLIFEKDDPSGLPENAASFEVPVKFSQEKTMTVKVFFSNEKSSQEMDCTVVYPLKRTIPKTQAVARAALEQLLGGPSDEEKNQGYFTSINPGVKIQVLSIQHGVAFVDFDEQLEAGVAGSCRVAYIRTQIEETLRQFPTVKEVHISINGRTEDILQP